MSNAVYDDQDQDTQHGSIDMSGFEESLNGPSAHGTGHTRGTDDSQGESDTRADLRSQEGLKGSGARDHAKQQRDAEKKAELAYLAGAVMPSKDLRESEEDPSFYKKDKKIKGKAKGGWLNRKRAGILGAGTGLGIGGLITISTLVSGPLEFIHMAQLFHHAGFSHQESAGDSRMSKLYRYLREGGSAGETRLGWLESKYHARILGDLANIGFEPTYGTADIFQGFTVDTEHENSPYKGMTPEEAAQVFQEKYGITPTIEGGKLRVSATGFFDQKPAVTAMLREQGLSGVAVAARARIMGKFGLVPGAFHPLRYVDQKLFDTAGKFADFMKNLISQGEDPAQVDTTGAKDQTGTDKQGNPITTDAGAPNPDTGSSTKVSDILDSIKTSGGLKIAGGIAVAIGIVCAAKAVDDNIGAIRYIQVIVPLIRIGMLAMTMGYQIESGQDVPLSDMNHMASYLNDVGKNGNITSDWSDNAAVRSEEGLSGGSDPLAQNGVKDLLKQGQPGWLAWTQNGAVGALCSGFGQAVTGVVSVVVGIFSDGIASTALGFVASALAGPLIINKLAHMLAGQAIDLSAHGATFGEEGIYGAHLAGNNSAIHDGAVQLTATQTAQLNASQEQIDKQAFDSQSFFARIFNIDDYQSLTGRLADDMVTTSFTGNITNTLSSVTSSLSNTLKLPFTIFSSIANAATPQAYDYPFPEYDFSQADLDNSAVGDPYQNANDVAAILDAQCLNADGSTNTGCTYISKAESCFGDQITKDNPDHVWDVIPDNDINPYDPTHYNATDCQGAGDPTWLKIRFFILDTGVMEGYACASFNDPTSCSNNSETGQSSAPTGTTIPSGSAEELANLILESPNISFQTPQEKQDFTQIAQTGHQTNCGDPAISPTLLGIILTASQQYKLVVGVVDDGHACGDGVHDHGLAVDLNGIDPVNGSYPGTGNFITWAPSEQPLLLQFYNYMGNLLSANGGGGMGQLECFTSTQAPTAPTNVTYFNDTCDHVHVDVLKR
jgi:hypothetical protein